MDKTKNSEQKINLMNNESYNNNKNINYKNESQNEIEEVNEILIEQKYLMKKMKKKFIFYVIKTN